MGRLYHLKCEKGVSGAKLLLMSIVYANKLDYSVIIQVCPNVNNEYNHFLVHAIHVRANAP